jgi:hypothetical protein
MYLLYSSLFPAAKLWVPLPAAVVLWSYMNHGNIIENMENFIQASLHKMTGSQT